MPYSIVLAGSHTAGVTSPKEDGRRLVFRATNPAFATLDGSSFANRHAVQRAVDRIARLEGLTGSATTDGIRRQSTRDTASA